MKALVLSDLHLQTIVFTDIFRFEKTKRILQNQIKGEYDIVLISGDIFESSIYRNDVNGIFIKLTDYDNHIEKEQEFFNKSNYYFSNSNLFNRSYLIWNWWWITKNISLSCNIYFC